MAAEVSRSMLCYHTEMTVCQAQTVGGGGTAGRQASCVSPVLFSKPGRRSVRRSEEVVILLLRESLRTWRFTRRGISARSFSLDEEDARSGNQIASSGPRDENFFGDSRRLTVEEANLS